MRGRGKAWVVMAATVLLLGGAGCDRRQAAERGVKATPAYEEYFGAPPTVAEGTCFARAGFFPREGNPGKVSPVPLFLFTLENQRARMVDHLIAIDPRVVEKVGLWNPFPPGASLKSLEQEGEVLRVELNLPDPASLKLPQIEGMAISLAHTLGQFQDVARVVVTSGGEVLPRLEPQGYVPIPSDVIPPGAPVLLQVNTDPEKAEIFALFDRPVRVESVLLADSQGNELKGTYFQSIFDTAVIFRPADIREAAPGRDIRVSWKVEDRRGRRGQGEETVRLEKAPHF